MAERTGMRRTGLAVGFLAMMLGLPVLSVYLWLCVHHNQGALILPSSWQEMAVWIGRVPGPTWPAVSILLIWFAFHVVLQLVLPGRTVLGAPLRDGGRLAYRMNGLLAFVLTYVVLGLAVGLGFLPATLVHDHFGPLLVTANLFALGLAAFVYVHGKPGKREDRASGNFLIDFFLGVSLNPRIGRLDLKVFCENRPGLIGWTVVNFSLMAVQFERLGTVTVPMVLVCVFQFVYIADHFVFEDALLTTMDVMHEKFGWMLVFGDLVWVPFTYSLQAYYLLSHPHELPAWATLGLVACNGLGLYLFRASNLQKHRFKQDPTRPIWGGTPATIPAAGGTSLLVSGWWGVARHMNYTGDLIMALAWGLPCLFGSILPYFYFIYFAILLIHRERRDHRRCLERYGEAWRAYTRRVRWRFLPGIY